MTKTILFSALLFMTCFANASEKAACLESGQTSPYIGVEYSTGKDGVSEVEITTQDKEGKLNAETLKGAEPDLGIMRATDENGDKIVIIQSFIFDEKTMALKVRTLVCSPAGE